MMMEHELIDPAEALMDGRVLREILDLLGSEGPVALHNIVQAYLLEAPQVVEDLGEALSRSDHSRAALLVHRLKGSSLSIGASRLAARCAALEETCYAERTPHPADYAALLADFTDTRGMLKTYLKDIV